MTNGIHCTCPRARSHRVRCPAKGQQRVCPGCDRPAPYPVGMAHEGVPCARCKMKQREHDIRAIERARRRP